MTEVDLEKLSTFHTKCLRKITRIFLPKTKSSKDLLAACNQQDMATILMKGRWKWIGHVIRKDNTSHTKQHSTGHQSAVTL